MDDHICEGCMQIDNPLRHVQLTLGWNEHAMPMLRIEPRTGEDEAIRATKQVIESLTATFTAMGATNLTAQGDVLQEMPIQEREG